MTTYRHCTNLRTPFDDVDLRFLALLGDYRLGPAIQTAQKTEDSSPMNADELHKAGIVGLYTTAKALSQAEVVKHTGWTRPAAELGEELA